MLCMQAGAAQTDRDESRNPEDSQAAPQEQ